MITLSIITAIILDRQFGETRRFHPLVGFGRLVCFVEKTLRSPTATRYPQFFAGLAGWLLLTMPPAVLCYSLLKAVDGWLAFALQSLILYFCLGYRSLGEHSRAILAPLLADNFPEARRRVSYIVSRDTDDLDSAGVTRAAVESVLENGNDAVFASLFWFAIAGAPGALLHRLANTLDARWGYRNSDYCYFGKAAARLDDLLNWVPARLCAFSYALTGAFLPAMTCWRRQAPGAASPNAGPVMAAGAGALEIELGGPARYRGELEPRPPLGCGKTAAPQDIDRALHLLDRALLLWLGVMAIVAARGLLP
jgi:adenosylcobinamide-phosphate synthase